MIEEATAQGMIDLIRSDASGCINRVPQQGNNTMTTTESTPREAWLEQRRSCVCASDIPQLLGYYGSPVEVYLSKVEGRQIEDNDAMMLGRCLEAGILQMYKEKNPDASVVETEPWRLSVGETPHHGATPDAWIVAVGEPITLIEIKHTSRHISEPTPAHVAQVQWQMHVTDTTFCDLVYVAAGKYLQFRIERDDEQIANLIALADHFWFNHVVPKIPPEPLTAEDAQLLWPVSKDKAIEASDITRGYYRDLRATRERIAVLKAVEAEYKSELQRILKDADTLTIDGVPAITWKTSADTTALNVKRLKAERPEIWEEYAETKPGSRRFLVKGGGDE